MPDPIEICLNCAHPREAHMDGLVHTKCFKDKELSGTCDCPAYVAITNACECGHTLEQHAHPHGPGECKMVWCSCQRYNMKAPFTPEPPPEPCASDFKPKPRFAVTKTTEPPQTRIGYEALTNIPPGTRRLTFLELQEVIYYNSKGNYAAAHAYVRSRSETKPPLPAMRCMPCRGYGYEYAPTSHEIIVCRHCNGTGRNP